MKQISLLTDLSNDLFFEIFDYIDVLELFQAFYNLNQRFNILLTDRHNSFQVNMFSLKSYQFSIYKSIILPKISCYIRYLCISDEFHYLQMILRSFSLKNLLSVRLYHVKLNELMIVLKNCQLKSIFIDTKYIQNETHLNEIFRNLFSQQFQLNSIQCDFHTNLHFLNEKNKLSKLRHVILTCDCFSSDFIILISQLPNLRYLSARINDYRREYMDKDIDHLHGNDSIYSLILHISNVELDRLLLIFSLMINVHKLELNGSIDFDVNYLLEFERNYTSFRCNLVHCVTF